MLGLPIDHRDCQHRYLKVAQTAMCTTLHALLGHTLLPTASVCSVLVILRLGGPDQAAVCRPRTRPLLPPPTASAETQLVPLKSHMARRVSPRAPRDGAMGWDVWGDKQSTVARWESQSHSDGTDETWCLSKTCKTSLLRP